jgi:threonine dehydratase
MPVTPALRWPLLSERLDANAIVKHENHTPIGSFKLRGSLTYMANLARTLPSPATILASTRGNHGLAVAYAAAHYGMRAIIVVPNKNNPDKNRAIVALGAELIEHGDDYQSARQFGAELADRNGFHLVNSFTPQWLSGIATCVWEFLSQAGSLRTLYVPVGMGSGICSAIWVKSILGLKLDIVGVVAQNAPAYALSFEAGAVVSTDSADTIADGLAARTPNPNAVAQINGGAARFVRVSESEILAAMRIYLEDTHNLAEPAAAAALGAALKEKDINRGQGVGLILTGGNATVSDIKNSLTS